MLGYESLIKKVKEDCKKGNDCFNEYGCNVEKSKCGHKYCDTFKWIIDRAKHYEEMTGINYNEILDKWESKCNYWYMNYYQEANQPRLDKDKVYIFETMEEVYKSIGNKKFRCPYCGEVSSSPYICNVCDWNIDGLFGDLGKGVFIFVKEKKAGEFIFRPVLWENGESEGIERK